MRKEVRTKMVEEFNEKEFEENGKPIPAEPETTVENEMLDNEEEQDNSQDNTESQSETQIDEHTMEDIEREINEKENSSINELKDLFSKQFEELKETLKQKDEEITTLNESLKKQTELMSNLKVREPQGKVTEQTDRVLTPEEIQQLEEAELSELFGSVSGGGVRNI